jgi:hypothetical protein
VLDELPSYEIIVQGMAIASAISGHLGALAE